MELWPYFLTKPPNGHMFPKQGRIPHFRETENMAALSKNRVSQKKSFMPNLQLVFGTFSIENETAAVSAIPFSVGKLSLREDWSKNFLWALVGFYGAFFGFCGHRFFSPIPRLGWCKKSQKCCVGVGVAQGATPFFDIFRKFSDCASGGILTVSANEAAESINFSKYGCNPRLGNCRKGPFQNRVRSQRDFRTLREIRPSNLNMMVRKRGPFSVEHVHIDGLLLPTNVPNFLETCPRFRAE